MKHFTHFSILVFIFVLISLAACKTVRTSEKAVSESETAAVTASRLTFYRTLDALSRQFNLSADSISIIFLNESPYDSRCFIFHTFIHLNNPCYHKKAFSLILFLIFLQDIGTVVRLFPIFFLSLQQIKESDTSEFLKRNSSIMNKRKKLQVSLAVFGIIYFIVLLVSPGWGAAKILGIISIVGTFLALYESYRADEKKKGTDK